jgi:toxin-antitoxin system PIN domain toxin
MILMDVNVLLYAHKEQSEDHVRYRDWLASVLSGKVAFGYSEFVLSAFVRIVTHPRIFDHPSSPSIALQFAQQIREAPQSVAIKPGARHWELFTQLVRATKARGNLVPDAYFAALAIESGCIWVTTDRDYAKFDGLSYRHPLG